MTPQAALNEHLEALRGLLYSPSPTKQEWEALCLLLDGLSPGPRLEAALDYCVPLLRGWPSWLRVAPKFWGWTDPRRRICCELSENERQDLRREKEVVWLEPLESLDYVRQRNIPRRSPHKPPVWSREGRMVGYTEAEGSRTGMCRVFVLLEYDRDLEPEGVYRAGLVPPEGVDPRTVLPGVLGVVTARARHGRQMEEVPPDALSQLHQAWSSCQKCRRHNTRTAFVPGSGGLQARVLILGLQPGPEEARRGMVFPAASARILSQIIQYIGLPRQEFFLTTLLKCNARSLKATPRLASLEACQPLWQAQVDLLCPEVILAWGRETARALMREDVYGEVFPGQWTSWRGFPVMVLEDAAVLRGEGGARAALWPLLDEVKAALEAL